MPQTNGSNGARPAPAATPRMHADIAKMLDAGEMVAASRAFEIGGKVVTYNFDSETAAAVALNAESEDDFRSGVLREAIDSDGAIIVVSDKGRGAKLYGANKSTSRLKKVIRRLALVREFPELAQLALEYEGEKAGAAAIVGPQ